jgi:hypothetical protein
MQEACLSRIFEACIAGWRIVGFFDEQWNGGVHSFSALSERIDQCDAKSILRTKYVHIYILSAGSTAAESSPYRFTRGK